MKTPLTIILAGTLSLASPAWAAEHEHHHGMPMGTPAPQASPMAHGDMAAMDMSQDDLMSRMYGMGSGTSLQPALTPMRAWMLHTGDWMWMFHGDAVAGYDQQGGLRGAQSWAAENWAMAMGSRRLGPGFLDLRAMTSLDGLTMPPGGTPQLFQTGEGLLDHQHPHDLFMELSARYTWSLSDQTSVFVYGGFPGEPALGPEAFMHRASAMDNHWAPLGHHLQDSTHITFGVATAGVRWRDLQLEASSFNGTEPDANRFNFDAGPLDSWSTRLSWAPTAAWSGQVSYGHLANPEAGEPGPFDRTTASVMHVGQTGLGRLATSLIWGQNLAHGQAYQSYGLEGQLDRDALTHLYGRFELVDKEGLGLDDQAHRVGALTLGGVRDLGLWQQLDLGVGADATVYSKDADVTAAYGFNPFAFRVYLRLRPPEMKR